MASGTTINAATEQTEAQTDLRRRLVGFVARASFRARLLTGVWLLFALLVVSGIHGSSIQRAAPVIASIAFALLLLVTGVMLSLVAGGFPR